MLRAARGDAVTVERTADDIERALNYFWDNYQPSPDAIWASLSAAANMGIDVSQAPEGSICCISKDGATFHLLDEKGYPI